jgi:hypothetical protein
MGKKKPAENGRAFVWRTFLERVSGDLLQDVRLPEKLPDDVIASGWLGYKGASAKEIAALEKRLGRRLPPSYRAFLEESDGWRQIGSFIYKLWPCSEVGWFRERNQDWIDAYTLPDTDDEISDKEYLVYGDRQDTCRFRTHYLETALQISDEGDSAVLLLNPEVQTDDGEWEAWLFANWLPGASRYRSFRELMEAECEERRRFRKSSALPTRARNPGQLAACRGETDKALALLRESDAADDSSAVSLAELCAFRGLWNEVIDILTRLSRNPRAVPDHFTVSASAWSVPFAERRSWDATVYETSYPEQLFRLFGAAGHATGEWKKIGDLARSVAAREKKRRVSPGDESKRGVVVRFFENLEKYCRRRGRPFREPVPEQMRYFGIHQPTEAERLAQYKQSIKQGFSAVVKSRPIVYARNCFVVARRLGLEDPLIGIYKKTPAAIGFDFAVDVARVYMRRDDAEAAWGAVRDRVGESAGIFPEQVAPIVLMWDDELRPLMTPERCEFVLATPRRWQPPRNEVALAVDDRGRPLKPPPSGA